jgi:carboxyl-terminal processing protease
MAFNLKKIFIFIFVILAIFGSFNLGVDYGKDQIICESCKPEEVNFSLFWQAWGKIQKYYVDKAKFNTQEMIYGAISGMVESLNDPYTVFMKPDESKRFTDDVNGSFEGVGMEIGIKKGQLQVVAPLEGTPAEKAGLRAGDKIVKIGDKVASEMTTDEAVNLIRGPKGTEVILTIYRDEWGTTKEIKIIRGVIEVPSVKLEIKEGNIAYIEIFQFSGTADDEFQDAAISVLNSSADRIIIDLRNNPGGYLEIAQKICGWFLERGQTVTIEDYGEGKEQDLYRSNGNAKLLSYPVVILINEGSASASEIMAGALRDNRGIKLIGEQSFGKGSVQEMKDLTDKSSIKITVAKWLTPNGESISEKGLEPDITVEITDKDYEDGKDPQLDKAIEIIKNL